SFLQIFSINDNSPLYFYYSLHLRPLHSFPTRRSSDLPLVFPRCHLSPPILARGKGSLSSVLESPVLSPLTNCDSRTEDNDPFPLDRKSTRLNSSHVAISYAVFCLKKKK